MTKTTSLEFINTNLPEIDDSTIKEIAALKLTEYPKTVEGLKLQLKTGQKVLKDSKTIIQDELKLFTEREKQYTKLIEEMIDIYNNDYAKPHGLPYFARNGVTQLHIKIHDKTHLPTELLTYIKDKEDQLITNWFNEKYENENIVPLIEGIETQLIKVYKGVK